MPHNISSADAEQQRTKLLAYISSLAGELNWKLYMDGPGGYPQDCPKQRDCNIRLIERMARLQGFEPQIHDPK